MARKASASDRGARAAVLLTGFGPFPTVAANATALLVPTLAALARSAFPGYRFHAAVLATEWQAAPDHAERLVRSLVPVLAIHFGVSRRARGFVIETRAVNRTADMPDACGASPGQPCLMPHGDAELAVGLPARLIVERLRARALPAMLSRDAGTYLCNAVLYRSCTLAVTGGRAMRTGFVHLPATLVDERRGIARSRPGCPLGWDQAIDGSLEIIAACLGRAPVGARRKVNGTPSASRAPGARGGRPWTSDGERH